MSINDNHHSAPNKLISLFRRGPRWREIDGYHVEDLNSEQPVWVTAGSTMLGNIIAPQIKVSGMVNGNTVAETITIMATGQIWGDIYTGQLQIEPGGRLYGWISSIDTEQYRQIQEQGAVPDNMPPPQAMPETDGEFAYDPAQMDAFNRLRYEAAVAKTARFELEHTFEMRLAEVAGETAARVATLSEELATTRTNLATARQELAQLENKLITHQNKIERQAEELTTTHTLLEERNEAFNTLQQKYDEKSTAFEQLDTAYKKLDVNYITSQQKIDRLANKIDSLESALQDNLQHSAEQEEALIRWQELAEDYKKQIEGLETELEANQYQVKEHSRVIEMLRSQRDQLEAEWEQAQQELELLRSRDTRPLSTEALENERALTESYEEAQAELAQLKTIVSQLSQYEDQVIWYQADLETARAELQETRAVVGKQETRLTNLQAKLKAATLEVKNSEQQINELQERLQQQTHHTHALEQRLNQMQILAEEKTSNQAALEKSQQQFQLQLEAAEMELERHLHETEAQGQHLAEIQATLVEREIKMEQLKKTAVSRAQTIIEIKNAAHKRIQTLEERLAQSQKQVQELKAFIERSHKKSKK